MRRNLTSMFVALTLLGTLAGLYNALLRFKVEQHNRRVELAVDYTEVNSLAQLAGKPVEEVLRRFKEANVSSVAINEETFQSLEQGGQLRVDVVDGNKSLVVSSPELYERIRKALEIRGVPPRTSRDPFAPGIRLSLFDGKEPKGEGLGFAVDYATIRPFGIGVDPHLVAKVRAAGLFPIGRIGNFPGANPQSMVRSLADLKGTGVNVVIFQGIEVLGYRGQQKEAATAIQSSGLIYGQVEFGKQKGDEKLSASLNSEFIRVHSIGEAEMSALDDTEAVDRFVRAARERNIRLNYIRLLTSVGEDPVQANVDYVARIARGISRGGEMGFGRARLYEETGAPSWTFLLLAVGVASGASLLLLRVAPLADRVYILFFVLSCALCVGLVAGLGEGGRKMVALLAALVFPTVACLNREILSAGARTDVLAVGPAAVGALRSLFVASMITGIGIVHVVGLLATRPFMVKSTQFMGIKAAHALPLLFVGLLAITTIPDLTSNLREELARIGARLRGFLSEPMQIGTLLLALVGLVAFAMIVARTGNEPGVGVSGLELKFRALLDRILPVRPRTKEFMIGHPAFVMGVAFWLRGRRQLAVPLFVVGVIGQVSILNTFCHIHTPLWLSFIRDVTGLVAGAFIGVLLFVVFERTFSATGRRPSPAEPESA